MSPAPVKTQQLGAFVLVQDSKVQSCMVGEDGNMQLVDKALETQPPLMRSSLAAARQRKVSAFIDGVQEGWLSGPERSPRGGRSTPGDGSPTAHPGQPALCRVTTFDQFEAGTALQPQIWTELDFITSSPFAACAAVTHAPFAGLSGRIHGSSLQELQVEEQDGARDLGPQPDSSRETTRDPAEEDAADAGPQPERCRVKTFDLFEEPCAMGAAPLLRSTSTTDSVGAVDRCWSPQTCSSSASGAGSTPPAMPKFTPCCSAAAGGLLGELPWGEALLPFTTCGSRAAGGLLGELPQAVAGVPALQPAQWSEAASLPQSPSQLGVTEPAAPEAQAGPTSVNLRNLPNNYKRDDLEKLLDSHGFAGKYDFLNIPMDFRTHANLGYAFVNLVSPEDAERMRSHFDGFKQWSGRSRKVCSCSWAQPYQGLDAHVARSRNSPLLHESVPDVYRPALFRNGARAAFPPPTKKIKPPRQGCERMLA